MPPKLRTFTVFSVGKDGDVVQDEVCSERLMIDNAGMAVFFRDGQAIVWIAPGAWTWIVDDGPVEEGPAE